MWKIFGRAKTELAEPKIRIPPRVNVGLKRNYQAGVVDRLTASWTTTPTSIDQVIVTQLTSLRARSREQTRSNDHAKKFLSMVKSNVVGQNGITVQSNVAGRNNEPDTFAQDAIEMHFKKWCKRENCSLNQRQSFKAICGLGMTTVAKDGETLVRLHPSGAYGLQLEMLDAERLDVLYNDTLRGGSHIRFGIEFNSMNIVTAYHLSMPDNATGADVYVSTMNRKKYQRIPANQIIHLFLEEEVEQKRGLPWMSTALQRMKMLQGYEDASLVAARAGASKMGFYKPVDGDEYTGKEGAEGEILEDFDAGSISVMPQGLEWQTHNPDYPAGEFAVFMKACLRGVASGLGVSYNSLANDLEGVNFSSMRHGAVEEREVWKELQAWLIENFIEPIYKEFVTRAYTLGMLQVPTRTGMKLLNRPVEDYLNATYQPKRWDWVDPLKDIQARKEEVQLGVTSVSSIIRDKGRDPEQVWKEIEQEREKLKTLGIYLEASNGANAETKEPTDSNGAPNSTQEGGD